MEKYARELGALTLIIICIYPQMPAKCHLRDLKPLLLSRQREGVGCRVKLDLLGSKFACNSCLWCRGAKVSDGLRIIPERVVFGPTLPFVA